MTSQQAGGSFQSVEWAVAERSLPGQDRSGDRCVVLTHGDGALLGVVDGLGHGRSAAVAAAKATAVLEHHPDADVTSLMRRCHEALQRTRGAAVLLMSYRASQGSVTWIGVGNVEGLVLRRSGSGARKERILMRGGVVGYKLPTLRPATIAVERSDLLIAATDGIRSVFAEHLPFEGTPWDIAHGVMARFAKDTDDALVLVARLGEDLDP